MSDTEFHSSPAPRPEGTPGQGKAGVAYVADRVIPPSPPPSNQTGTIAWLRENLFAGPVNSAMTIGSFLFVVWALVHLLPWLVFDSVWNADSLSQCREISPGGACWAVVNDRLGQWMYGFFPADQTWRADLAFVLMFVALLPVLFDKPLVIAEFGAIVIVLVAWARALIELVFPASEIGLVEGVEIALLLGVFAATVWVWNSPRKLLGIAGFVSVVLAVLVVRAMFGDLDPAFLLSPSLVAIYIAMGCALAFGEERHRTGWFMVTALYPLVAYFLIWGGTIWGPLLVLAAPAIGYGIGYTIGPRIWGDRPGLGLAITIGVTLAWLAFAVVPLDNLMTANTGNVGLQQVESATLGGMLLTLIIGVVGIAASLPLGIMLALGRKSNLPFIKGICVVFIEFIRGVPLITLLFVANVVLAYFLPPGTDFDKLLRVLIMVTFFASAYIAEVIRGGLAALPQGQYEAADSMGLTYWQSMRLIILPQALKISIPGIVNTFIGLFKDTTLVSVIALFDPLGIIQPIRSHQDWNGLIWEPYLFVALFFFVFCFGMSRYSMWLERRLAAGQHR